MVVDTAALIAIYYGESGYEGLEQAIAADITRLISVASVIEASIVVARRAEQVGRLRRSQTSTT